MRFGPQETATGRLLKVPPKAVQPVCEGDQRLTFQALWYIWLSGARAKMSIRFGPQQTATGALLRLPPSPSQPDAGLHAEPFQNL
jgi:hypothetical protein